MNKGNHLFGEKAKKSFYQLLSTPSSTKTKALLQLSENLKLHSERILKENKKDLEAAYTAKLSNALIDRLTLTEERISKLSKTVLEIAGLPDPIGEIVYSTKRENGLVIHQERVPIGVVLVIFESRPNVVIDIACLCLKSGNASILRGGKEALNTNSILGDIISETFAECQIDPNACQVIRDKDRGIALSLLQDSKNIDVVVPRGGPELIAFVTKESSIPVIKHDAGVCTLYIHKDASQQMAIDIAVNAKTQRPGVCNAIENILFHKDFPFTKDVLEALKTKGVTLKGDSKILPMLPGILPATEEDWVTEYLDLIISAKIIDGFDEAVEWINHHGSNHSDAIVTKDYEMAGKFLDRVDSACVFVNASTRFADGGEFGLGAEVGISTQKLHVRGPMGIKDLTCLKYKIYGHGQTR